MSEVLTVRAPLFYQKTKKALSAINVYTSFLQKYFEIFVMNELRHTT